MSEMILEKKLDKKLDKNLEKQSKGSRKYLFIGIAVLFLASLVMTMFLIFSKWEPSGGDIWGHLYKSDYMYRNIKNHNIYPLYSEDWYNGIQLYRYWPPFVYYVMSLIEFACGGNIIMAYCVFSGFVMFVGGLPFIFMGNKVNKNVVGTVFSIVWFILPDNIRVFFGEGNMPRIMTSVLIPFVVYFLWSYIREKKLKYLVELMITMIFMTVTHLMITAIVGIGTFIFLFFDWIINKEFKAKIEALIVMIIGIMIAGIWVVPALSGGMMSMGDSSTQTQSLLTFPLSTSLNIMNRVNGDATIYYFGISILMVSIFGILLAKGKTRAGFFMSVLVLLGTTPATLTITKHLPLGDFLWMTRFTALAYAYFLLSFLEWKTLRKKYAIIAVLFILIDSAVTVACLPRYYTPSDEAAITDSELLKENTTQRASIMDLSVYGPYPSWNIVTGENGVDYTFGWAWQGAKTSENIMLLNQALEAEEYYYIFDRSIELGDDTVLVKKSFVFHKEWMEKAAYTCGYSLIDETKTGFLYKKQTPECFGVKTKYEGMAIGDYANTLPIYFPSFTVGNSSYIDDYTVEELKGYKTLFLSGFLYHNEKNAEELLKNVSKSGTRVVIDCAHFPENGLKQKKFLGVTENIITIESNMPNLSYEGRNIVMGAMPAEYERWQTGYANSTDNVIGSIKQEGIEIPFLSYNNEDKNIYYLGLNLAFFAMHAENEELWGVLSDALLINYQQVPVRTLVPVTIEINEKHITIDCDETDVNTTLAFQDNFETEQEIRDENNMLVIGDNHIEIDIVYPKFWEGLCVSAFGIIAGACFIIYKKRTNVHFGLHN